jgi:hypothetical protein
VDEVGNQSRNVAGRDASFTSPYLDLTAPKLSHQFQGDHLMLRDTVFINTDTKIQLQGEDSESGMRRIIYHFDGVTDSVYQEPFTITTAGVHEVNMIGYDNVNNNNSHRFHVNVDNKAPEIQSIFSISPYAKDTIDNQTIPVLTENTQIFLAATDDKVGLHNITYSINQQKEKIYGEAIQGFEKEKPYEIVISAHDKLGNKNSTSFKFIVR